jgi:hypothetical protein
MAWLETTTEIIPDKRQFWQLEYATYDADFIAEHGTVADAVTGERVLRRLIVQESDVEYRGLTPVAADALVATLVQGDEAYMYQGARARLMPSGGATVYAKARIYDPAGWSAWMRESALGTIPVPDPPEE